MKRIIGRLLFVFVFVISSSKQCDGSPIGELKDRCEVHQYDMADPARIIGPETRLTEFDNILGSPYNVMILSEYQYRYRFLDKIKMECYNIEGDIPAFKGEIALHRTDPTGYTPFALPFTYDSPYILICIECKIRQLTSNVTGNLPPKSKFTFLDFAASQMTEIDADALDAFTGLSALNLNDNSIKSLPDNTFLSAKPQNTFLLSLKNNSFDRMNEAFCNIKEFEFINLQNNKIQSMEIDCKIKVNFLNLSSNLISSLSLDWLENYEKLYLLDLSFNNLASIRDVQNQNLDLKFLILTNNNLHHLGRRWFRRFATLQSLNLHRNDITSIDSEAFKDLKALINLDLSENVISSIPFGVFNDLEMLKELNLAGNKLTKLSMQTFAGLTELKYLNLSTNLFRQIVSTDLLQIRQLQAIDLSNNRLQKLDANAILSQHNVMWMSIKNNFWNCRQLLQILQFVKEKNCNVKRGDLFGVGNIHGIACTAKNISSVEEMDFAGFLDTLSDEMEMELILSKLDSLPVDDSSALEIIAGKIKSLVLLIAVLFVVDFIFQWLFRLYQARHTITIPITNLK